MNNEFIKSYLLHQWKQHCTDFNLSRLLLQAYVILHDMETRSQCIIGTTDTKNSTKQIIIRNEYEYKKYLEAMQHPIIDDLLLRLRPSQLSQRALDLIATANRNAIKEIYGY